MDLPDLLKRASSGGGILFCGAGFSADCLNLSDNEELGTGAVLLHLLNRELENDIPRPYRELKNVADKFIQVRGENGLLALLRDRFKVSNIADEMTEIVRFPWDRLYTTNYDNALELACTRAGKNYKSLNNLDTPEEVPGGGVEIIHLHGSAEKWDIRNFRRSCVLGANSYFETDKACWDIGLVSFKTTSSVRIYSCLSDSRRAISISTVYSLTRQKLAPRCSL